MSFGSGTTQGSIAGTGTSFFSNLVEGISTGLGKVASDVLPVWAAHQLDVSREDMIASPTYNPTYSQPRLNDDFSPGDFLQQDIINTGRFRISNGTALLVAGLLTAILVLNRLR